MTARITGIDPTGSTLDRTAMCVASAALPQVFDANDEDDDSEDEEKAAERRATSAKRGGTAVHKFLERVAAVGREAALAEVDPTWFDRCASIDVAKLADLLTLSTEIAVAYNWRADTARYLNPIMPRVYEIDEDEETALTIDVGAYDPKSETVYSGDYKGPRAWLPPPERSLQLGVGALALARINEASNAETEYVRLLDTGAPKRFGAWHDVFGLAGIADRTRSTMLRVIDIRGEVDRGRTPNVTEGPWCRYCPAKMHCPAKTAQIRAWMGGSKLSLREAITPENAAAFYAAYKPARESYKAAESALYAYAKVTPIPVAKEPDGSLRFFGELARPGNDRVDGSIAHRVLTAAYGGEVANAAVTMKVTKEKIGDAVASQMEPGTRGKAPKVRELISEIDALGGISNPVTTTTIEYVVDENGAARPAQKKKVA